MRSDIKVTKLLQLTPHDIYLLSIQNHKEKNILEIVRWYAQSDIIKWVEPNFLVEIEYLWEPNDPNFPQQWHLKNTGQGGGTVDADVDADQAWDLNWGDPNIVIAILDSGVEITHPDFYDDANNWHIWTNTAELYGNPNVDDDLNGYADDIHGWNFVAGDPDVTPENINENDHHGTACAGVAAASNNNRGG